MEKNVIIALDFAGREETMRFLDELGEEKLYLKVGMELFYKEGAKIVEELKQMGHQVFLDLKLHDIPTTVKKAMKALRPLGADIYNVHAAGTLKMMEAAVAGLTGEDGKRPLLIAVTQLTSTDSRELREQLLISEEMNKVTVSYARNAKAAGLDGVVCSPLEVAEIHKQCGDDFITVTPGIRFECDRKDDQARVTTPAQAGKAGADYIVVGRSVTGAKEPATAYRKCIEEFARGRCR